MLKFRNAHPIWFGIIIAVLFTLAGAAFGAVIAFLPIFEGDDALTEFGLSLTVETLIALVLVLVLRLFHRTNLLTRRGSSFTNCLLVSIVPLALTIASLVAQISAAMESNSQFQPFAVIVVYMAAMMMIGIAEELMGRALVGETLLEHFGTGSLSSVWKAAVISGLIFGLLHLTNLMSVTSVKGVLIQAASAFTGGLMYAAIYYRTGNIWATVILHGLNDIAAGIGAGMFTYETGMMSNVEGLESADWMIALLPLREFLIALFLLRKGKLPQIQQIWSDLIPAAASCEKE